MTLQEWLDSNPATFEPFGKDGAVVVRPYWKTDETRIDLWSLHHLSDYVVTSSVSASGRVLVKR